jgi:hypothetical protein
VSPYVIITNKYHSETTLNNELTETCDQARPKHTYKSEVTSKLTQALTGPSSLVMLSCPPYQYSEKLRSYIHILYQVSLEGFDMVFPTLLTLNEGPNRSKTTCVPVVNEV